MIPFFRCVLLVAAIAAFVAPAGAQHGAPNGDWPSYNGDRGSTKYSPLDQINAENVGMLEVLWTWTSPEVARIKENPRLATFAYESTPIKINDTMYVSSSHSDIIAVNPETGEQIWHYDPKSYEAGRPTNLGFVHRGVTYYKDGDFERIYIGTGDSRLISVDAKTGEPDANFGNNGEIDLTKGLRREINPRQYAVTSPPAVCRGVVVVGASIFDGPVTKEMPPGDVRGFDARTGEVKWIFESIPQEGDFGNDTWEEDSWKYTGNANVWTLMSVDEELGHFYLPFGTPTNDWYGGHRPGMGLFGESLVCLDAETGERVWHFQHVHHGIWDYDLCAAPALMDITVDGKEIKALAQMTKQGFLWVLDRETGEGVWPIEEREVPQSTVPGEKTWPTQPFPTKPAPYEFQGVKDEYLIDFTPELHAAAKKILEDYNYGPLYTPATLEKTTIYMPGWGGGGNWFGCAFDPETDIIYVPCMRDAITMTLNAPDPARSNMNYVGQMGRLAGPEGLSIWKPPYTHVTAIDMSTGDHLWKIPVGDGPLDHPKLQGMDLPKLGDDGRPFPLATKSLLFIAQGSREKNLFAYDKETGEEVCRVSLPGTPQGAPMTYEAGGKQFIAIPVGGRGEPSQIIALGVAE
jgi:quinoprotein glucose dehydrogenase